MQVSTARNSNIFAIYLLLMIVVLFTSSLTIAKEEEEEGIFIDCSHHNCQCGMAVVIGNECLCPLCPKVIPPEDEVRVVHEPKSLSELVQLHQQEYRNNHQLDQNNDQHEEEYSTSRRRGFNSEENNQQEDDDCSRECLYGGKRNNRLCQCYCGKNEMTPENQPVYSCQGICHNLFIVEIKRNQYGCQSGCVCSKNIAFVKDFENLKLDYRSVEDNCKFLERSVKKMSQQECDEQCGKDIGGQLVSYFVISGGESINCSSAKYCKCNNHHSGYHQEMILDSNQSQCQRECNNYVSHVEYSLSNDHHLKCHCK